MDRTARGAKRILWVDDEIDLLKPHLLFLQARGYHVDAISNGVNVSGSENSLSKMEVTNTVRGIYMTGNSNMIC